MTIKDPVLRIAVRFPLWRTFDYLPPEGLVIDWQPGQRIKVPFGKREVVGILLDVVEEPEIPREKLKSVNTLLDSVALLPERLMSLFTWASHYYHHPIGDVILGSLPKLLREGRQIIEYSEQPELSVEPTHLVLNDGQQNAVDAIDQSEGFQTFCLQGVTGSGKTEVYLQAMAPLIETGKQALLLVPEIALTPQTISRFEARFKVPVVCLHSELTDKKRLEAWSKAYCGYARIIIGTRSAVFVPLKNPGMIVIDEAHDPSFKQQSGFRYSARDVAIRRAQMENLPIVLGSATPSLETLMNAKRERFQLLSLPKRAGDAKPPTITIVDLRDKTLDSGLSEHLVETIKRHLKNKGQVLLFLNRRGYAPTLMCHHCGWMAECARCDARMTLHKNPTRLFCHHCGSHSRAPEICNSCEQADLSDMGVGTEQLESALEQLFPTENIIRIDRDSTRKKGSLQEKLEQIHSGEANLLIGTQMLSKGHHFSNLSLVAIVDADGGLYGTDFRSMERMAQLLIQVSGRAGREERIGEVVIQTHHPDNALLQLLLMQGYSAFSEALLEERENAQLPPFTYLALLRAEAIDKQQPLDFLRLVKQSVSENNVELLGPIPAPMERRAGRYRAQLLIQSNERSALHRIADQLIDACQQQPLNRKVRWSLDIDPQDML